MKVMLVFMVLTVHIGVIRSSKPGRVLLCHAD